MDCKLIIAGFLAVCLSVNATTYYVDAQHPSKSDSNAGTSESLPWATIQKAATTVTAGHTVVVKAGTYNEYVTFANNGTAGNVITFTGERGQNGEWLTIIDPSTDATGGWTTAPEIGSGVWKKNVGLETKELTIDGKRVAFVYSLGSISGAINNAYTGSGLVTGSNVLALPSGASLVSTFDGQAITFWNSVKALWGFSGTTTYLRLRDGSDPSSLNIRVAANQNGSVTTDAVKPAVILDSRSYVSLNNFAIRGAFAGVRLLGNTTHHITIASNYISGGYARVLVGSGAYSNSILNNEMPGNYYGFTDIGAWGNGTGTTYTDRQNVYLVSKFLMGTSESFDAAVKLDLCGAGNVVASNHVYQGVGTGINLSGSVATPTTGTLIYSNRVDGHSSVGIILSFGHTATQVYDNSISDCNANMRFHAMDRANESNRVAYIYRNRVSLPADVGSHIYFHFYGNSSDYRPLHWLYHNSFSGGKVGLDVGLLVADYDILNVSGLRAINNIFSATTLWVGDIGAAFWTDVEMVGAFDYNLLTPPLLTYPSSDPPVWAGSHNVTAAAAEWSTASVPAFALNTGSPAINSALDVTQSFVIDGVTYDPLPASAAVKVGAAWDMGAVEYGKVVRVRALRGK